MSTNDTSSFFTNHQTRDVPRDQWGRYKLPGPDGAEMSYTRATTLAATLAEQYGLSIWKQRQVVWGLSRRPDLMTMASTIAGPEDKKALGAIVDEAHIAGGTQAKANKGSAIHKAIEAAERGHFNLVPKELRIHVSKYFAAMRAGGLTVLPEYIERTVIIPEYDTAGTFDNLVRCPDGKIRVGDKKTGRLDYSDTEFAVQMALYANASAMFNYDTGRYEPLPDIARDYAILAHIDPETGHTELQRVNIEWGWVWARTCAEVMAIRKTKGVITPYVPPEQTERRYPFTEAGIAEAMINNPPADLLGVPVVVSDAVSQPMMVTPGTKVVSPMGWIEGDDSTHLWLDERGNQHVHPGPLDQCDCSKTTRSPMADAIISAQPGAAQRSADALQSQCEVPAPGVTRVLPNPTESGFSFPAYEQSVREKYGSTAQVTFSKSADGHFTATVDPSSVPDRTTPMIEYVNDNGAIIRKPAPYLNGTESALNATPLDRQIAEFRAFWSDDRHDTDPEGGWDLSVNGISITEHVNGVSVEQYGQPNTWPCSRGESCEFTGQDGLHTDGTVCLYGNARPAPVTTEMIAEAHGLPAEALTPGGSLPPTESDPQPDNVDNLIAKIDGLKTKAMTQAVVRSLMDRLGIKEGEPGFIKLNQYKINMAKAAVTLAHKHRVPIIGPDGEDWGVPTGPAPTGTTSGKQSAPKAVGAGGAGVSPAVRTAVASIRNSSSIAALKSLHDHYANKTEVGWTEEMQNAARTRALELEGEESGDQSLTPMQMIEGATSKETLQKAWNKATDGGKNRAGWTTELNEAAIAKQSQLGTQPAVATTGNQ